MAWSPTGEYIATGHLGGFSLWDGETGELVGRYPVTSLINPQALFDSQSITWSPDGTRIASRISYSFEHTSIQIIGIPSGNILFEGIEAGELSGLAWSPDGTRLAVPYLAFPLIAPEIRIYDVTTTQLVQTLTDPNLRVLNYVKWSPDGERIAATYATHDEAGVMVWNTNTGAVINQLPHETALVGYDWSFDSTRIASTDFSNFALNIWDVNSGTILNWFNSIPIADIDWSPIEDIIAVSSNNRVHLIDADTGAILFQSTIYSNLLTWHPDGSRLASMVGKSPIFYTRDGQTLPQFPSLDGYVLMNTATTEAVLFLYDGDQINLNTLTNPEDLDIQAVPNLAPIQSVRLELNGEITIFNQPPYILPLPPVGTYTLTGTPYTEPDAQGTQGTPLTITFTVINEDD